MFLNSFLGPLADEGLDVPPASIEGKPIWTCHCGCQTFYISQLLAVICSDCAITLIADRQVH